MKTSARALAAALILSLIGSSAWSKGPVYAEPEKAQEDPAFAVQGEYSGEIKSDGESIKIGVQVIALGEGKLLAASYHGGLPGDGWDGETKVEVDGELAANGLATFKSEEARGVIEEGVLTVTSASGEPMGQLKRVERKSETLGQEPPAGAVVLFDGKNVEGFRDGARLTDDGLLRQGATSKATFGDHKLHIEFRLPYEPENRGQARGNSGIYLQGRYEVQMLDSFGLEGKDNECGGIYTVSAPTVNMCFPPLAWQTYDIDFTAAKYDDEGKLQASPRVTVRHNGVVIHDDVELPADRNTTAAPNRAGAEPGPVYLQDHGNEVRYRNIWVVPAP